MKTLILDPETAKEIKGLQSLLLSGIKENIDNVWQINEGLKIPQHLILDCYKEIFELLKKFKKISSKKLNKDAFFELTNLEHLDLDGNSISDATPFANLTNLKYLRY
jgi:Leucine-rich repeat (LRR) protein